MFVCMYIYVPKYLEKYRSQVNRKTTEIYLKFQTRTPIEIFDRESH